MEERLAKIENELSGHIEQENQDVLSLRRDLNGNLAKIHASLLRMEPVIKKYEDEQVFNAGIKKVGSKVIWWSQVLGGGGVFVYAIRAFIKNGF